MLLTLFSESLKLLVELIGHVLLLWILLNGLNVHGAMSTLGLKSSKVHLVPRTDRAPSDVRLHTSEMLPKMNRVQIVVIKGRDSSNNPLLIAGIILLIGPLYLIWVFLLLVWNKLFGKIIISRFLCCDAAQYNLLRLRVKQRQPLHKHLVGHRLLNLGAIAYCATRFNFK